MGKHFWFGSGLLAGLLVLSLVITGFMSKVHTPTCQVLEQARQAAARGNTELAQSLAAQAEDRWQRFRSLSAAVADHDPIEETDSLFAQLEIYGQAEEWTEFTVCCALLNQQVQAMVQAHIPSWWNLL